MMRKTLLGAALLLAGASFATAQIVVDFNDEGTTLTEAGFLGIDTAGAGSAVALGDGISVTFVGYSNTGGRDRGTTDLTAFTNFFRDGYTGNDSSGKEMDFLFSGLVANTDYELTFWAWDRQYNNDDVTVQFFNTTDGSPTLSGSVDLVGVQPTSLSDYDTTFTITSSAAGTISLDVFGVQTSDLSMSKGVMINGFEITATAIPEPSTYVALTSLLALGLVLWRKRR